MIRLSVCIATLNRSAVFGATLDSIIAQATEEVEIVVVDGASTDNTEAVVRQRQQAFPRLNYVRLMAKGGVDQDYSRAVEEAQGEFCWLMSDDDLLKPGAVQAVLNASQQNFGLIVVNAEVRSLDLSHVMIPALLPTGSDRRYVPADFERLFVDTASYMSFIGCVVVRRQLWASRNPQQYFGTEFVHVGVIFGSPLPQASLVIAQPWITIRYGNASWTSRYFQIWMFKWPDLIWSLLSLPAEAKRQVTPYQPWRRQRILLLLRAKGAYGLQEYNHRLKTRLGSRRARWVALAIALAPGPLVHLPVFLYYRLFRSQQSYGLQELRDSPFSLFTSVRHQLAAGAIGVARR